MKLKKFKIYKFFVLMLFTSVTLFYACNQEEDFESFNEQTIKLNEQKADMQETARALAKIVGNPDVQKEVYQLAALSYEGVSGAQFKHLLEPSTLPIESIGENARMKKTLSNGSTLFALDKSLESMKTGKDGAIIKRLLDLKERLVSESMEIYWPYWQNWDGKTIPTVTFDPMNPDQEANVGYLWHNKEFQEVQVDDNYAFENPVWVVKKHRTLTDEYQSKNKFNPYVDDFITFGNANFLVSPCDILKSINLIPEDGCGGGGGTGGGTPTTPPQPDPSKRYNKLFVKHIKMNKNFRGLFGGPNDISFIFAGDGVIEASLGDKDATVTKGASIRLVTVSRWMAKKKKWGWYNVVLEQNWDPSEVSPVFGVVGHQLKDGGIKFEGEVGTNSGVEWNKKDKNWKPTWEVGIEFKVKFKQDYEDKAMSVYEYERSQFFLENWRDADEQGMHDGRAIRIAGSGAKRKTVWYTMDVKSYND